MSNNNFRYSQIFKSEDLPEYMVYYDRETPELVYTTEELRNNFNTPFYTIHRNNGTEEAYEAYIDKHPTELDPVYVTGQYTKPSVAEMPKTAPTLKVPGWWNNSRGVGMNPIDPAIGNIRNPITDMWVYSKHFFQDTDELDPTIIPLDRVKRMTHYSNGLNLFNEFTEFNNNTIRLAKDFRNTTDRILGDRLIPLSSISQFWGIEDGKLKIGSLDIFNDNTTVMPVRNKNIGKVKEIIHYDKPDYWKGNESFVTENNDTIPVLSTNMSVDAKSVFGDENGNSYFVYNLNDPTIRQLFNEILKKNPLYPVLIDNGRYQYFDLNHSSNTSSYASPFDDVDDMYIVGK